MAEPQPPSDPGLPRFVWAIIYVLGFLALLFLGATIVASIYMSPERLEAILNEELDETTQGRFEAQVGGTSLGLLTRSFSVSDLAIVPTDVALDEETHPPRYHLEIDRLRTSGIGLWDLWRRGRFTASSVSVVRPVFQMETTDEPFELEEYIDQLHALPQNEELAGTRIGAIRVEDARLELTPLEGIEGMSQTYDGLSLEIDDFFLDPEAAEDENRLLIAQSLDVQLDSYEALTGDEVYALEASDFSFDTADSTFSMAGLTFSPTIPDEELFAREPWSTTRYQSDVGTLRIESIDFRSLITDLAFSARTASLDAFQADIFHDATDEEPPDPGGAFPHEMLQELGLTIDVDDIAVGQGFVRYAERAPGAEEPGMITFEEIEAGLAEFFSAPETRAEQPTIIEGQTLLNGAGLLEVRAEYDLTNPNFFMDLSGSLSEMELLPFNQLLEDLEGIRITGGRVHDADFDISIRENLAQGSLRFRYEGLDLELLEGATETRIARALGQLLADELLPDTTLPEVPDEDRDFEASIRLEREPDHTFFEFLWLSLRDGLFEIVGLEELLP